MKNKILLLSLLCASSSFAGTYVAEQVTITKIANSDANQDTFMLWLSDGSGTCANAYVKFPVADAGNADIHKRAYSTALAAFTTGLKVSVYNYHDTTCMRASYIEVHK